MDIVIPEHINIYNILNFFISSTCLFVILYNALSRFPRAENKIINIKDFLYHRAIAEAVDERIATKIDSVVEVTEESKTWVLPILKPIREFYETEGRQWQDRELMFEIERRFGETILNDVCMVHGLSLGACLIIILAAVRDKNIEV